MISLIQNKSAPKSSLPTISFLATSDAAGGGQQEFSTKKDFWDLLHLETFMRTGMREHKQSPSLWRDTSKNL